MTKKCRLDLDGDKGWCEQDGDVNINNMSNQSLLFVTQLSINLEALVARL